MAVFEYQAMDAGGRKRKGYVDADDARAARAKVRAMGLYPSSLKASAAAPAKKAAPKPKSAKADAPAAGAQSGAKLGQQLRRAKSFRLELKLPEGRPSGQQLATGLRQLATLLSAGLPLDEALTGAMEQAKGTKLHALFAQLRERIKEGHSLAESVREHPGVFSPSLCSMIEAGESSGTLDLVMVRLAEFAEQEQKLKRKVFSAMAYPALMLVVGFGIVAFLLAYVVPRLTQIFVDLNRALPAATQLLLAMSDAVSSYWWAPAPLGLLAWAGIKWLKTKPKGRRWLERALQSIPVLGALRRAIQWARFCRTLGNLHTSGVPLLTSMSIVANVAEGVIFQEAITAARQEVSEGAGLAPALGGQRIFPPLLIQLIAAGERSGQLDAMLIKAADIYEEQIEVRLTVITTLLEPVMILMLGGVVGFVVLAVLLPIFEMSSLVN